MKDITVILNVLKRLARMAGERARSLDDAKRFWSMNKIYNLHLEGYIFEVIFCFLLGVIQKEAREYGVYCYVENDAYNDKYKKTDVFINKKRFQIKFNWNPQDKEVLREELKKSNVYLLCVRVKDDYGFTSATDFIREALIASGQKEKAVEDFCFNSLSLDLAEEIWDWFIKS